MPKNTLDDAGKRRKMRTMSRTQNSAKNSAKSKRGNPDKTKPFRWPRGTTGNPGGRPKKKPITELYTAFADLKVEELPPRIRKRLKDREGLSLAANGVLGMYLSMGDGSHSAGKEIGDRLEGRVKQQVELSGDLTVDINKDIVERLQSARTRAAKSSKAIAGLPTKPGAA
jgi:hypothetical protein